MTRVTLLPGELAKLTRTVTSAASASRPSGSILINASRSATARARRELEGPPTSERTLVTTSHHRPAPNPHRVIPLMQGFHATQAPTAQADVSTIDFAVLPYLTSSVDEALSAQVRVPLLPDNFAPDRVNAAVGHVPEAADAPLAMPEIVVVAADPEIVHAFSEVEGMSPEGVELSFVHDFAPGGGARGADEGEGAYAGGMLKDLWKGLVEDVFGGEGKTKPAL